jgi:hypothetical protein
MGKGWEKPGYISTQIMQPFILGNVSKLLLPLPVGGVAGTFRFNFSWFRKKSNDDAIDLRPVSPMESRISSGAPSESLFKGQLDRTFHRKAPYQSRHDECPPSASWSKTNNRIDK